MEAKVIKIGNSKGIRIPKKLIEKYHIQNYLELIENDTGILVTPKRENDSKLSWDDTYKEMAGEHEDWSDFDSVVFDGLK